MAGQVCTSAENPFPIGIQSPGRPAHDLNNIYLNYFLSQFLILQQNNSNAVELPLLAQSGDYVTDEWTRRNRV